MRPAFRLLFAFGLMIFSVLAISCQPAQPQSSPALQANTSQPTVAMQTQTPLQPATATLAPSPTPAPAARPASTPAPTAQASPTLAPATQAPPTPTTSGTARDEPPPVTRATGSSAPAEALPAGVIAETFVPDAGGFVVALAFAPDRRLFYTTKPAFSGIASGQVRIVENGALRPTPFLSLDVDSSGERGLLGIALDPLFATNRFVYLYYTVPAAQAGGVTTNRVARYTEDPTTQTAISASAVTLLDVPVQGTATNHNGGNIHFGPDGYLYVTIGDNAVMATAQDPQNPRGKIHRITRDGAAAPGNPFAGQSGLATIWSYGHRNSFDFTFDPFGDPAAGGGRMFISENGPNCDDKIYIGKAGANYGWPLTYSGSVCQAPPPGSESPIYTIPAPIGISGIEAYQSIRGQNSIVAWDGDLFWCGSVTSQIARADLNGARTGITKVATVTGATCSVDVEEGPDGALYITSASAISRLRGTNATAEAFLPSVNR